MSDAAVTAWCAIRRKQALFDPIDYRPRIYLQETANFVCCIDRLTTTLRVIHHAVQVLILSMYRISSSVSLHSFCGRRETGFISVYFEIRNGNKHTHMDL